MQHLRTAALLAAVAALLATVVQPAAAACENGFANTDGDCAACNSFYWGPTCMNACSCRWGQCNNGTEGTGTCRGECSRANFALPNCRECTAGYYGPVCQHACMECFNGGTCSQGVFGTGACRCPPGYYGRQCTLTERSRTLSRSLLATPAPTPAPPPMTTQTINVTTATPNVTSSTPGTAAPITTAATRVAGLRFTFLADVTTAAVLDAAQTILGATNTNGMTASAEVSPNPASYLRILVFTPTLVVDEDGVQMRYATLIQRVDTDPSNPMSALSMIAMGIVNWAPTPTPAPPVTSTPLPLPSEGDDDHFPTYAIVLIAFAFIAFVAVVAVTIWFWYTRRLVKKDAKREREEKERAHQREVNASRMAGESLMMSTAGGGAGGAPHGSGNEAARRVTFGAGGGNHDTMALPASALAPEREFAQPQPMPTYGDDDDNDDGAAYRVAAEPAGRRQYSPDGSQADDDDDGNALMVGRGPAASERSTAVGSNADVAVERGAAARRVDPTAADMDLNQDVELDMVDDDDLAPRGGNGRIALSDDDDDGGAGNPIF